MKKSSIFLIMLIILLWNCRTTTIEGVWMRNYYFNYLDTGKIHYNNYNPFILNIEKDSIKVKHFFDFASSDNILRSLPTYNSYYVYENSHIIYDDEDQTKVHYFQDSLWIDINGEYNDTRQVFRRLKHYRLGDKKEELQSFLVANRFLINNKDSVCFEFMSNGALILNDVLNEHNRRRYWMLVEYLDELFLVLTDNSHYYPEQVLQIKSFNSDGFTVIAFGLKQEEVSFKKQTTIIEFDRELLLGKWICEIDTTLPPLPTIVPRRFEDSSLAFPVPEILTISDQILYYRNNDYRTDTLIWRINKENNILFVPLTRSAIGIRSYRDWQKWNIIQLTNDRMLVKFPYYSHFPMSNELLYYMTKEFKRME